MTSRDRLRELLDAVLADDNSSLEDMAASAYASPFHFSRTLTAGAGEPPVALRRRVLLERAAWRLARGASVTETALEAGYDSVDGFARAFARAYGHPPSATTSGTGHRLAAPNGVHFHPPTNLWIESDPTGLAGHEVLALLVHHDVDDVRGLIAAAAVVPADELERVRRPGQTVLAWDGAEESIAAVLDALVWTKEVWLASIAGTDQPARGARDIATLTARHAAVGAAWTAVGRDAETHGRWSDRVVDALCDPPESFALGGIVAHVLTFSAHRRQLVRSMLDEAGASPPDPDPLAWLAANVEPTEGLP